MLQLALPAIGQVGGFDFSPHAHRRLLPIINMISHDNA
jgi:hypothetical protein